MSMMTLGNFRQEPPRIRPAEGWLREILAPAEEIVYENAGMKPSHYAPIGVEVPPAYRIPLHLKRYKRQIAQSRNQMTVFPSPYYARVAPVRSFVQPPFQFSPVEFESPWTRSGVRILA